MAANRTTQLVVENLLEATANIRTTQLVVENLLEATANIRTTQFVVEMLVLVTDKSPYGPVVQII